MQKDFIVGEVSKILNEYELKGLLRLLIVLSEKARTNKHEIGKTIRRRNSEKEKIYGECKYLTSIFNLAKEEKRFFKESITELNDDLNLKIYTINFLLNTINLIKKETILKTSVLSEIEKKVIKMKLSIEEKEEI